MMSHIKKLLIFLLIPSTLMLGGCIQLTSPPDDVKYYVLDPPALDKSSEKIAKSLLITRIQGTELAMRHPFVIRTGDTTLEEDFYNRWLVLPSQAMGDLLYARLSESTAFSDVFRNRADDNTDLVLEGFIDKFEIDLRQKPAAVITVQFKIKERNQKGVYRLKDAKFYRTRESITALTPEAMAVAWNVAVSDILNQLFSDLIKE